MPAAPLPLPQLDADDPAGYGAPLLQALAAGEPAIATDGCQALIVALERIALAVQGSDPARLRRQAGWWGRLLGRDVTRQAEAAQLQAQLGVLALQATEQAHALRRQLQQRAGTIAWLQAAADALQHWADHARAQLPALPAHAQSLLGARMEHLQRLAALRTLEAGQWQLLLAQDEALLQRFTRIHDVLLPAWRQAALAQRARAQAALVGQAAALQAQIDDEVAAAQARLR
ncbi:hypothetical protein [Stenotrophomonas sp. 24(2023)]|uniref:hypothetical protein n=1 Tax=Stenotrophomonas sp. 24(2023) TaxID=3068324 RepID=UPI0027E0F713|nr:hypothetical protein [Stenotrophomonas sp. 24(2023)]WMJ69955.1 hypothetical protein Q9R17_02290 [Stenotrophomonas sp. 24(2023)]